MPAYSGGKLGVLSKFMNTKKAFNDAQRVMQFKQQQQGSQQASAEKIAGASNQQSMINTLISQGYSPEEIQQVIGAYSGIQGGGQPSSGGAAKLAGETDSPKIGREVFEQAVSSQGTGGLPKSGKRKASEQAGELKSLQIQKLREELSGEKGDRENILKRKAKLQDTKTNFLKVSGLMRGLVSQAKGMGEEQGGLGLVQGLYGDLNTLIRNPKFSRTAAFPGQRRESALALNSILTGQNRVIKGVLEMINETLPNDKDPASFIANKVEQTMTNAYGLIKAFEKAGYTPDVLSKLTQKQLDKMDIKGMKDSFTLTPEEEEEISAIIEEILSAQPSQSRTLSTKKSGKTSSGISYRIIK